ncbi:hypothetical protein [Novosphingobium mangrovi (ex Huang et al. 2023)]|uniref:Uncharacterized protein n=1 Tax=Novosphingobium mangrovi (ex Huang et al. 2023) TaxID=2976432 RepID=A0ABT2I122_9SPHN|nr:hypothetical protein [Novosphingobium mangrovi (ex Huang et al. 2023)]MCT2398506.1 hypothetical protein [Novosphingobium mangrovi (ex Huang et al. 2023)]
MSRYRPDPGVGDVIAYLERRRANCLTVAERSPDEAERATVMRQQLDLILGDLRAGMHEGEAGIGLSDDPHDWMEV